MKKTDDKPSTFRAVSSEVEFPEKERNILDWWERNGILEKYIRKNNGSDRRYSFIDGPITANNPMGVHHAWGRTYKDLFHRFRNAQGFSQRFQNGFDGQGLWVEVEVEREKGFGSKKAIENYGIDRFVEECKARVLRFSEKITEQSKRMGYFMDWDNSYQTMSDENNYAIWNFLKKCHESGWLYEGEDVMPWCTRCGTGLSQHEIVTDGYREVEHPSLYVLLPLLDSDASLLIWTTTPWTLTGNVAAAVQPDSDYILVENRWETSEGEVCKRIWLSSNRVQVLKGEWTLLERCKGKELVSLKYRGPFDELPVQETAKESHAVIPWADVSDEEGTGIVHIAPGSGAEDFRLGREMNLPAISPLDDAGFYKDDFGYLSGVQVTDAIKLIYESLKEKKITYRLDRIRHRYPCCWRCGTELVFRLVSEWFISMDELRPRLMKAADNMRWMPSFGKERELDWLANMQDWMISKKRYWGLALPIYKCSGCSKVEVIGSRKELHSRAVENWDSFDGHSPHRPWVDAIKIKCSGCSELLSRIKDVGNPWLDAGIVGYSTLRFAMDRNYWSQWFPADWISESFPGQFRNWFYSLIAMSVVLSDKPPAKAVFSYALMRDEKGEEMHKSRGNAIWFEDAAESIGVDVMRWLFVRQNPALNLNFGYRPCHEVRRQFIIPLWNIYSFFVTYARLDGWTPEDQTTNRSCSPELDLWALAELNQLTREFTALMEEWRPDLAVRKVEEFVGRLSNWYVRRSRRRFWKKEMDDDKKAAYSALYECLKTLVRLIAPIAPFVSEEIYQNLEGECISDSPESVHLADWPAPDESLIDRDLIERSRLAIRLVSIGRSARSEAGIKVRQPLSRFVFSAPTEHHKAIEEALPSVQDQIMEELNVREVVFDEKSEAFSPKPTQAKPKYPLLGPKYGTSIKRIACLLAGLSAGELMEMYSRAESGEELPIGEFSLKPEEVVFALEASEGYSMNRDKSGWIGAVSTQVTPELRNEGWVRETLHRIQNLRKSAGLDISDRISLQVQAEGEVLAALKKAEEFLTEETLAEKVEFCSETIAVNKDHFNLDNYGVVVSLRKA